MEWTQQKIYDTIATITAASVVDPAMRKQALEDPRKAIEQVAGFPLPDGVSLKFVENQGMSYVIGLPKPQSADGELSDEDLAEVAGGVAKKPTIGVIPNLPAPSGGHPTTLPVKPGQLPPGFPGGLPANKRY
jgi:hypothetical protein